MSSGGLREGAGRPKGTKKPNSKVMLFARIDPDMMMKLNMMVKFKKYKNKSKIVREALVLWFERLKK